MHSDIIVRDLTVVDDFRTNLPREPGSHFSTIIITCLTFWLSAHAGQLSETVHQIQPVVSPRSRAAGPNPSLGCGSQTVPNGRSHNQGSSWAGGKAIRHFSFMYSILAPSYYIGSTNLPSTYHGTAATFKALNTVSGRANPTLTQLTFSRGK